MPLRLRFHKDVARVLERLAQRSPKDYRRIRAKLEEFAKTERGDIKQVIPGLHRLRIGDWRAYFGRKGDEIFFTDLVLRPRAYQYEVIERAMKRLGIIMTEQV